MRTKMSFEELMQNMPNHVKEDLENTIFEYDRAKINAKQYEDQVRATLKPYKRDFGQWLTDWRQVCRFLRR